MMPIMTTLAQRQDMLKRNLSQILGILHMMTSQSPVPAGPAPDTLVSIPLKGLLSQIPPVTRFQVLQVRLLLFAHAVLG